MMGSIMPDVPKFRMIFIEKVEDVAVILLLPYFCLRVTNRNGLINDSYLWKVTAAIIAVAVIGKFLGSLGYLRFVRQNWKIV
jgi:Kef-type K+ transport system membrane component KefB